MCFHFFTLGTQLNGRGEFRQGEDLRFPRLNIITARDKPFRCVEVLLQPCSGVGRKPRSTITMSTYCRKSCSIWLRVLFLHDTGVGAACIVQVRCWFQNRLGQLRRLGRHESRQRSTSAPNVPSAQKAWTTRKSTTIDLASSVGLNGMKVDTSSLKWIASSSLVFNSQLCCKEEWDDAVQRTAWCKSSSYMSCCDFGVPCDCSHHSVTAQASGRLTISIAGIWSSSDPAGSRCQVPIAGKTSPRSRSPSLRFGRSQARRVKTWRPITGTTSLCS